MKIRVGILGMMFVLAATGNLAGQVAVFGGNQYQTFSSAGTTNGGSTDGVNVLFASVGQPMATSSPVITETQAGILSAASAGLLTAVVSQLIITPSLLTSFQPGLTNFIVKVTDAAGIANTQLHFKPIAAPPLKFDSVLLASPSPSATDKTYSQAISNSAWYDDMGIEYFYSAKDLAGKWARNPTTGSYFSSLVKSPLLLSSLTSLPFNLQYKIVAFPYDSSGNPWQAANVYKVTADQHKARMFHWDPASKHYFEYAVHDFSTVNRGNGYWLLYASKPTMTVSSVTAPKENRNNLFKITLKANSWNQIGNPYPVPVSWNDVLALDANKTADPNDLSKLNIYTGSSYDSATSSILAPFEGGFVHNFSASDISLYLPFQGQTKVGARVSTSSTDISGAAWNIFLHIKQAGNENENVIGGFGMNPGSLYGPDKHDNYNPPPIVPGPEVAFHRAAFPDIEFGNDVVPTQKEFQWRLTTKGESDTETELTWNSQVQAENEQLYLFDPSSLALVDMLSTDHYQFVQKLATEFAIYFGPDAANMIRPDVLKMTGPYPNPVQQDRTLNFSVAIPDPQRDAIASIQFFNSTGQPVGSYNQTLQPGVHVLSYKFNPDQAGGIYLYRLGIGVGDVFKSYSGKIIIP